MRNFDSATNRRIEEPRPIRPLESRRASEDLRRVREPELKAAGLRMAATPARPKLGLPVVAGIRRAA